MAFFSSGNITIDANFVRISGKSYPIDKISSIRIDSYRTYGRIRFYIWLALALFFSLFTALFAISPAPWAVAFPGPIALWLWVRTVRAFRRSKQMTYELAFSTASGVISAIKSSDEVEVAMMRDSIESAIAGRT